MVSDDVGLSPRSDHQARFKRSNACSRSWIIPSSKHVVKMVAEAGQYKDFNEKGKAADNVCK